METWRPPNKGLMFVAQIIAGAVLSSLPTAASAPLVKVGLGANVSGPITGRVFLFLSTVNTSEPRFLVGDEVSTQQFFGMDVEAMTSTSADAVFDSSVLGYPVESLSGVPVPATYTIQAVVQPYHEYNNCLYLFHCIQYGMSGKSRLQADFARSDMEPHSWEHMRECQHIANDGTLGTITVDIIRRLCKLGVCRN